jgi:putative SOS response-associated peptidase YedK
MCGKFSAQMRWDEYVELAGGNAVGGSEALDNSTILGRFTPMSRVPVLHLGPVRQRRLTLMRWGWPKNRAPDPARAFSHLHARAETIDTTMTWMAPFSDARGVIFATEFNIGEELPNGKTKQWICARRDGQPVVLPVLYSMTQLVEGNLWAFVMVTQDSIPPLSGKDNRMPALLDMKDVPQWLGERPVTATELKAMLLRHYGADLVMREQEQGKPKAGRNTTRARAKPKKPTEPTLI